MSIHRARAAYYDNALGEDHRYRSWEHCYSYFRRVRPNGLAADRDRAMLQLAFYLASWGMYRESSFLLGKDRPHRTLRNKVADWLLERPMHDLAQVDELFLSLGGEGPYPGT